jgi:hypothetical protein
MKKFLFMLIFFTGICLNSNQLSILNYDNYSNSNLRFYGLLAYHQGEINKAHKLLSLYLKNTTPNEDDWKVYVIFHLVNRDLERCDFNPINIQHIKIIEKTDWNNKIEELNTRCEIKREG